MSSKSVVESTPTQLTLEFSTSEPVSRRSVPGFPNAEKIQVFVETANLPLEELGRWIDVNPRIAGRSPQVHEGIQQTVRNEPNRFVLKNAGLILSVKSVRVYNNNNNSKITAILDDPELHGLIDGNNTRHSLMELAKVIELSGYLDLTIFRGLGRPEVVDVASGQNIRKPVQKWSLLDFTGYFDLIRKSLGEQLCKKVVFCEGDEGDVKIGTVISAIQSLNTIRYGGTSAYGSGAQPLIYAHTGRVLKEFEEDMGDNPSGPPAMVGKALSRATLEIMTTFDKTRILIPEAWKSTGSRKYGSVQVTKGPGGNGKTTSSGSTKLPFLSVNKRDKERKMDYQMPDGLILPLFSSFRANVDLTANRFAWKVPIDQFLNVALPKLTEYMYNKYMELTPKPFDWLGKHEEHYRDLYGIAERAVNDITKNPNLGKAPPAWRRSA